MRIQKFQPMISRFTFDAAFAQDIPVSANLIGYGDGFGVELTVDFFLRFGRAELNIPSNATGHGEFDAFVGTNNVHALGQRMSGPHSIPLT